MAHRIQKNVNFLELKLLTALTELFDVLHNASAHITTFFILLFYFTLSSVNKLLPNLLMQVNVFNGKSKSYRLI